MKLFKYVFLFIIITTFFSCKNDEDVTPMQQNVVTSDSSSSSGELTVSVQYKQNGTITTAGANANVRLYFEYEDIERGLYIYDLYTNDEGNAYFGFINIGTYYIYSEYTIGGTTYIKESAVQVRSQRDEQLTITLDTDL
jgi:hypothetical protein